MRYENCSNSEHFRIINSFNPAAELLSIEGMAFEEYEKLWFGGLDYISDIRLIDSEIFINKSIQEGKRILAEGAQGTMLDIDFGTYPFVTSSSTISAGVCSGLGISPNNVGKVFGVFKAYCTRVGSGPFPTELLDATGDKLRENGKEFGSTTGRPRRCGWIDLPALHYAVMLNGVTDLVMMKADVMDEFENIGVCTKYKVGDVVYDFPGYETLNQNIEPIIKEIPGWKSPLNDYTVWDRLPEKFRHYVRFIEKSLNLPISVISVGPRRDQTIVRLV
jgi:adenylosuccinate synthase